MVLHYQQRIIHHKCIKQQWIKYQLFGVLKNEINKSDTIFKKRNIIRVCCPYCHVEKLWFVLFFLLTLFIYLFVFAQLVWLFKKPSFFSSFSSYFLFRCLCFALFFFLHILINILFFILIGFVVISMSIRKYERKKNEF